MFTNIYKSYVYNIPNTVINGMKKNYPWQSHSNDMKIAYLMYVQYVSLFIQIWMDLFRNL